MKAANLSVQEEAAFRGTPTRSEMADKAKSLGGYVFMDEVVLPSWQANDEFVQWMNRHRIDAFLKMLFE